MWAMGESISSLKRIIYVTSRSGAKLSWKRSQECEYKQESRSQYPILPYLEAVKQPLVSSELKRKRLMGRDILLKSTRPCN